MIIREETKMHVMHVMDINKFVPYNPHHGSLGFRVK